MGIDALLYVEGEYPPERIEFANAEFRKRFGDDAECIEPRYDGGYEWVTLDRYYGPGYERGDWPRIYSAIMLMQRCFPEATVFYGGDSSDYGEATTPGMLNRMWDHWCGSEWNAYRERWASLDQAGLEEIQGLLDEAYDHYFEVSDGYCKSIEGVINLDFGTYFARRDGDYKEPSVTIYSYVLGPSRSHYFETIAEALLAVREWHAEEMVATHEMSWD